MSELLRLSGAGRGAGQLQVQKLLSAGVFLDERVGNQRRIRVNAEFPLYSELRSICLKSFGLADLVICRALCDLFNAPALAGKIAFRGGTPITTALKAAVIMAVRDDGISEAALARRMHVNEKEARRMLDPGHPTEVPTLERALAALGRRAAIEVT